ncbi:MAG: M1 family aminopeptidase [Gemmatimonadota bacterium]|nr:M1 family aminopeptidase [Gemmatimonadota bacterium]
MRALTQLAVLGLVLLTNIRPGLAQSTSLKGSLPLLTRIELAVRVDYESERVVGTATLTLENASTTSLARVPLLLNRLMRVKAVRGTGGGALVHRQRITSFEDVGKFQVNAVEVDLPATLLPEESVRLAVAFEGYLVGYTEVGMLYVRDHVDWEFTILREDALAFPVVGVPSMRVNRAAAREPFDFEVSATVPQDLIVATGGEQIGRAVRNGLVTWRFRSREPAPYLIVTIAPYQVIEAGGLRVFHFPGDSVGAQMVLQASRRAAARLQEMFGPHERALALNVMEIPDGWGSQASLAGGIIQEASAFRDRDQMRQLYHEMSHLWNARDVDTPSPRWNEGLAMFLQDRLAREIDGWDGGADALQQTATRLLDQCGSDQRCSRVPLRQYGNEHMTDLSYSVGRLMFAVLYHALGDEVFDRALYRHYQARKASGTSTDDIVRAFVDVGGPVAQSIFDDWLESAAWIKRLRDSDSLQAMFDGYRK